MHEKSSAELTASDSLPEKGYTYDSFFPEAAELAEFINKAYRDGKDIICQCEYGQSRSAGCAAAILEHFYRRGIDIFAEYKYYPNQVVYHKVFDALESAAFQPTEYLQRVHDYSGTKYPFDRNAIEESLNKLTQTERDILYMYLWDDARLFQLQNRSDSLICELSRYYLNSIDTLHIIFQVQ